LIFATTATTAAACVSRRSIALLATSAARDTPAMHLASVNEISLATAILTVRSKWRATRQLTSVSWTIAATHLAGKMSSAILHANAKPVALATGNNAIPW
jgi:hypothetical protein